MSVAYADEIEQSTPYEGSYLSSLRSSCGSYLRITTNLLNSSFSYYFSFDWFVLDEAETTSPKEKPRNLIAYWLLGLCNNYAYVIMLSAAHDILSEDFQGNVNFHIFTC